MERPLKNASLWGGLLRESVARCPYGRLSSSGIPMLGRASRMNRTIEQYFTSITYAWNLWWKRLQITVSTTWSRLPCSRQSLPCYCKSHNCWVRQAVRMRTNRRKVGSIVTEMSSPYRMAGTLFWVIPFRRLDWSTGLHKVTQWNFPCDQYYTFDLDAVTDIVRKEANLCSRFTATFSGRRLQRLFGIVHALMLAGALPEHALDRHSFRCIFPVQPFRRTAAPLSKRIGFA